VHGVQGAAVEPRGAKAQTRKKVLIAALKALRHPKALRGAEAPLFHGDGCFCELGFPRFAGYFASYLCTNIDAHFINP
jgi:hypothetical protein